MDGIAFVAQDMPLYKNLSAADLLHLTRNLNRRFDRPYAEARLEELGIPLTRLVLAYLREPGAGALPGPARGRPVQPTGVTK